MVTKRTTTATERASSRWRRRKAQRPSEIVSAALQLFVERGFSATRLDDVAKHSGISKGTLYLYFDSKEALLRAVVRELVLPELQKAEQIVAQHQGSSADLLRRLVDQWWSVVGETRLCGIPKLVTGEAGNFPEIGRFFVKHVVHRGRRLFARVLARGIASGEFAPLDVNYGARLLVAPLVFAAIWECSLKRYDTEPYEARRFIGIHVDTFIAAHRAAPAARRRRA
jgi:AcrR family transcriptional regulator